MARALTKAGRYQIVSELGRGSMGIVYQGYDPVIGRTVAIKTMLTEGLPPQEFQEYKARFQREAQAAGVLTHPNIVTVYDFGEDEGVLFLAMEFLDGKSLEKLVEEQNILPLETIVPMYDQVCGALDHAHAHKIVHRDIKPANIMILGSGQVKVTDFGIARMMAMGMTQAGQILGTPNYMSPEQVKGRPVDGRSDIFSLGVILYELVTGEKPFGGQNITTVIYKIINENPIPPRELDATIPLGLNYVISKALAKSPEERYQTCRELAEDLKNYKNLGGVAAPSATVVIKVPPIQGAQAGPAGVAAPAQLAQPPAPPAFAPQPTAGVHAERPPVRPLSVQVIPPAKPAQQGASSLSWVLLTLLIVGALGGGGYYFFVVNRGPGRVAETASPAIPPVAQPPSAPATPTTTESNPPPTSAQEKPERSKVGESARGGETIPFSSGGGKAGPAPKFGQLLVTSNITGARISIDGRNDPNWVTPHTFPELPAGTHAVLISKEGYDDVQQSVSIEGGRTSNVSAQLSAPVGEVNIITNPPGAEILIDGQSAGTSPVHATLAAGAHTYTVKRPGAEPYNSNFTLKSGGILTRRVELGGAGASTGIVEVRTIPPGATVIVDNSPVGSLTPTSFRLSTGRHTLVVSLSGFRPVQREVVVSADGTQVNLTLPRQ